MTTALVNGRTAGFTCKGQSVHDAHNVSDTSACTSRSSLPLSRGFGSLWIVLVFFVGVAVGAKITGGW